MRLDGRLERRLELSSAGGDDMLDTDPSCSRVDLFLAAWKNEKGKKARPDFPSSLNLPLLENDKIMRMER